MLDYQGALHNYLQFSSFGFEIQCCLGQDIPDRSQFLWVQKQPKTGELQCSSHLVDNEDIKADRNGAQLPAWLHHPSACIFPRDLVLVADWITVWKQLSYWSSLNVGVISLCSQTLRYLHHFMTKWFIFDRSVNYSLIVSMKKETSGSMTNRFSELRVTVALKYILFTVISNRKAASQTRESHCEWTSFTHPHEGLIEELPLCFLSSLFSFHTENSDPGLWLTADQWLITADWSTPLCDRRRLLFSFNWSHRGDGEHPVGCSVSWGGSENVSTIWAESGAEPGTSLMFVQLKETVVWVCRTREWDNFHGALSLWSKEGFILGTKIAFLPTKSCRFVQLLKMTDQGSYIRGPPVCEPPHKYVNSAGAMFHHVRGGMVARSHPAVIISCTEGWLAPVHFS